MWLPMSDVVVWIDCEMTGLSLTDDALIEVAALVTDPELTILDEGLEVVIKPPAAALEQMQEVPRAMHTASGLINELETGVSLAEATEQVMAFVTKHVPQACKAPLAGNSIATDRGFLARDMPALDAHLHYRMIDVSTIKELVRRWYPRVYYAAPEKGRAHRGMADIVESIEELRYYRSTVFAAAPGPTSEQAHEAAAVITAARAARGD